MLPKEKLLINFLYNPFFVKSYCREKINFFSNIKIIKENFIIFEYFCLGEDYKNYLNIFYKEIDSAINGRIKINFNKKHIPSFINTYLNTPFKIDTKDYSKIYTSILLLKNDLSIKNRKLLPFLISVAKTANFFGWTPLLVVLRYNYDFKLKLTKVDILKLIHNSDENASVLNWSSIMLAFANHNSQKLKLNSVIINELLKCSDLSLIDHSGLTALDLILNFSRNDIINKENLSYLIRHSEKNTDTIRRWRTLNKTMTIYKYQSILDEIDWINLIKKTEFIELKEIYNSPFIHAIYSEKYFRKRFSQNFWKYLMSKYINEEGLDTLCFSFTIRNDIVFSIFWNKIVQKEDFLDYVYHKLPENFGKDKLLNKAEIQKYKTDKEKLFIEKTILLKERDALFKL